MKRSCRMPEVVCFLGWIGLACASSPAQVPAPPGSASPALHIRILSDIALPPSLEWASDVRWAGERSVYLGLGTNGTVEASLDPAGPPPKEMIPGRSKPGGFWAAHRLAASSRYLVVAGPAQALTWRRLDNPIRSEEAFDEITALDVSDGLLVVVGARRGENRSYAPDGAIGWIGSLEKNLSDLKPILYDVGGPGAPNMDRCAAASLGAARFLGDGSIVVVPGVQPGVNLYDREGRLTRTWDTGRLGIDTDCASLGYEQSRRLSGHGVERQAWINQRRTVSAVVPLPQGIGLVVRRVEKERARWELKVLGLDGSVASYPVPFEGANGFFQLLADARSGKMVFLLTEDLYASQGRAHPAPPRLIVAELTGQ